MARLRNQLLFAAEILVIAALVLATRCANYQEVFVGDHIYYADADCYARMTRVRLCAQQPGLILRHHGFENFPQGTTPHTTAPLDYAILLLSVLLRPFTERSIDLAGALVSPAFALFTAVFLCGWSRYLKVRFRWITLILYAVSPILVQATVLGRPDHQSLTLSLVIVAICADWAVARSQSFRWSVVSGLAWGMAIWVSAYEPLILLVLTTIAMIASNSSTISGKNHRTANDNRFHLTNRLVAAFAARHQRFRWMTFISVLLLALLVERRIPTLAIFVSDPFFRNWSNTIGELVPVPLFNSIWLQWIGLTIVAVPFLIFFAFRRKQTDVSLTIVLLLVATFFLTLWQARWAYFFAALFVLTLPIWLSVIRSALVVWMIFIGSLWPVLGAWDQQTWPDEQAAAIRVERRHEQAELRELSLNLISGDRRPFLAPWWLSPAIAYWSGQPSVAGSSHESLPGTIDSAEFFLTENAPTGREILQRRGVAWVIAYDAVRLERNSAQILGKAASERCLARVLDQRPARAPRFLILSGQNGTAKLFQVTNKW